MHTHESNIENLTGLFKKYGAQHIHNTTIPLLYANTYWPNRCWFEWGDISDDEIRQALQSPTDIKTLQDIIPNSSIVSVWPMMNHSGDVNLIELYDHFINEMLIQNNWVCKNKQTAMYIEIKDAQKNKSLINSGFKMEVVTTSKGVEKWVDIGSEAFLYSIDKHVIEHLKNDINIQILLGHQNGKAIASALLYKSGDIIGIHQLGVKQDFQGQGIAKRFMQEILNICILWQGKYIVLQASPSGKSLYDNLGFRTQFSITNFHKI